MKTPVKKKAGRPAREDSRNDFVRVTMSRGMKEALTAYAAKEKGGVIAPATYAYFWVREGMKKAGIRWEDHQ